MSWQPILTEPDDAYERSPKRDAEGRIYWVCHTGKHRGIRSHDIPAACSCSEKPCRHFGPQLGTVDCGCGKRGATLPVHQCALLGPCMERSNNKLGTRWQGLKIVVCLGCEKRSV